MKAIVLSLLSVTFALALPTEEVFTDEIAADGWFVPQLDGSLQWMTEEEAQILVRKEMNHQTRSAAVVNFYLYTKSNPSTPEKISAGDSSLLSASHFNKNHPTRFIIHGWQNDYRSDFNVHIRTALLETGDYNIICVDWSSKSKTINYIASVLNVPDVGKKVAAMIDYLRAEGKLTLANLKIIGHSLGAHVSGYSGKYFTGEKIHSIIGLDPALPLYSYDKCSERLCETDADYVESIQTNGGQLGFLHPIGKAAFYPNGGKSQPGCGLDFTGVCAHARSYIYYSEAIRNNDFPSMKCTSYEKAVHKSCGSTYSSTVKLGATNNNSSASGQFYTPVNKESLYGLG